MGCCAGGAASEDAARGGGSPAPIAQDNQIKGLSTQQKIQEDQKQKQVEQKPPAAPEKPPVVQEKPVVIPEKPAEQIKEKIQQESINVSPPVNVAETKTVQKDVVKQEIKKSEPEKAPVEEAKAEVKAEVKVVAKPDVKVEDVKPDVKVDVKPEEVKPFNIEQKLEHEPSTQGAASPSQPSTQPQSAQKTGTDKTKLELQSLQSPVQQIKDFKTDFIKNLQFIDTNQDIDQNPPHTPLAVLLDQTPLASLAQANQINNQVKNLMDQLDDDESESDDQNDNQNAANAKRRNSLQTADLFEFMLQPDNKDLRNYLVKDDQHGWKFMDKQVKRQLTSLSDDHKIPWDEDDY